MSYFSILPIKLKQFEADNSFYKGVLFSLPLTGLLLSSLMVLLFIVLPLPLLYKSIFCSILYLFSYGFLHLEAVCDTIDGYFASLSKKDVYEVMHEPQVGSIGALGGFSFVLLKILALAYLLYYENYIIIIIALILSRSSLFFGLDFQYHEKSHFIKGIQNSFKTSVLLKILFLPFNLLTKFILNTLKNKLGFLNGDMLGFNIELQEIIYLNLGIILIQL
ncbi:adenosylcobinamide-GDP ribazoletransferase [Arcobacteraceae bacterium]|nr:adenosylcobinamide-GDP ribazoletransferase [Arcobacteraceae bacterium]